ncbi:MAG: CHAP domain-containing protein [Gaiellaceae bacterium]
MEPRASSVAVGLALLALAGSPAALVTGGYSYARSCPAAGDRDDVDRWKLNTCNCTSYVAWALTANGYRTDWFVPGAMDAANWVHVAWKRGLRVGTVARPGAVAVWPRLGKRGHVAFVTAVDPADGSFSVAEYNRPHGVRFGFDRRTGISPAGDVSFIYVPRR